MNNFSKAPRKATVKFFPSGFFSWLAGYFDPIITIGTLCTFFAQGRAALSTISSPTGALLFAMFIAVSVCWFAVLRCRLSGSILGWLLLGSGIEWLLLRGQVGGCYLIFLLFILVHLRLWKRSSPARSGSSLWFIFLGLCAYYSFDSKTGFPDYSPLPPFLRSFFDQTRPLVWGVSGYLFSRLRENICLTSRRAHPSIAPVYMLVLAVPAFRMHYELEAFYTSAILQNDYRGALFLMTSLGALFFMLAAARLKQNKFLLEVLTLGTLAYFVYQPLFQPVQSTSDIALAVLNRFSFSGVLFGASLKGAASLEPLLVSPLADPTRAYVSAWASIAAVYGLVTWLALVILIIWRTFFPRFNSAAFIIALVMLVYSFLAPGLTNPFVLGLFFAAISPRDRAAPFPLSSAPSERWITRSLLIVLFAGVVSLLGLEVVSVYQMRKGPRISVPERELRVSASFVGTVLTSEDLLFFKHRGIDTHQIIRSLDINLRHRSYRQGGSTITMQLAKLLYLKSEKTLNRKLQQMLLALLLECRYSKLEILRRYLEAVDFGNGQRGITAASRFYFAKEPSALTPHESLLLAVTLQNPKKYTPLSLPDPFDEELAGRFAKLSGRAGRLGHILERELRHAKKLEPASLLTPVEFEANPG